MDNVSTSINKAPAASTSAASTSSFDAQLSLASNIKIESSSVSESDSNDNTSSDEEENKEPVNENCLAVTNCRSGITDMRKVVSHIFGRNKSCTSQIAEECVVHYCRKHYQRYRYRTSKYDTWINTQIGCVRIQLARMEEWGAVSSWTVGLRLKARKALMAADVAPNDLRAAEENNSETETSPSTAEEGAASAENHVEPCRERFLVPYLGNGKTFADVHAIVDLIEAEAAAKSQYTFPEIEFLPVIDPERFPPAGARKRKEREEIEAAGIVLYEAAAAVSDSDEDVDDAKDAGTGHSGDEPPHSSKRSSMVALDEDHDDPSGARKRKEREEIEAAGIVLYEAAAAVSDSDEDVDDAKDAGTGHSGDEPPHSSKRSSMVVLDRDDDGPSNEMMVALDTDNDDPSAFKQESMSDSSSANAKGKNKVTEEDPPRHTKRSSIATSENSDLSPIETAHLRTPPHRKSSASDAGKRKRTVVDNTEGAEASTQPGPTPKKRRVAEANSSRRISGNPKAARRG